MSTFSISSGASNTEKGALIYVIPVIETGVRVTGIQATFTKTVETSDEVTDVLITADTKHTYLESGTANTYSERLVLITLNDESFDADRPFELYLNFDGTLNVVYLADINFTLSTGDIVTATVVGRDPEDRELIPVMLKSQTDPVFSLTKPDIITKKNALSVIVKTGDVPIKELIFNVRPNSQPNNSGYIVKRTFFDMDDDDLAYGKIAGSSGIAIDLVQVDFSNNLILEVNDASAYRISSTVITMGNNAYSAGIPTFVVYAPHRINSSDILHIKQSDSDVNDFTLDVRFKPPSDLLALESSGIRITEYIFTDGSGNGHIGGSVNDQSGNFLFDVSGNGRRFYYNQDTKEYKDASGNVTIAKHIGSLTTNQLLGSQQLDASGAYPLREHAFELLKNNQTIRKIGITARGSDFSTSRTAFVDISFNTDSAPGMWLAPKKPVINTSRVDNSGNLILSVNSFTRTIDVSGNFEVRLVDPSGNQTTDASLNHFTISANSVNNAVKGYNKERNYTVTIPLTAIPARATVRGSTLDISFGTPFDIGVKIFDLSGNVSSISEKFTNIKQTLPSTPFFKLRDVNVEGASAIYCSFDQSNNTIPLPTLGLGSRDASANQIVELDIYTRNSSSVNWPQTPTKQTISKTQYSALIDNDLSGVLLNITNLTAGQQVKVVGRIKVPSLTAPANSTFVSYDSREATFSALSLTRQVSVPIIVQKNDPRDMSGNPLALVDRSLTFTFTAPQTGADLEDYYLDVFVNDLSDAIYCGYIDASGTNFNFQEPKKYIITLNSTTNAAGLVATPVAFHSERQEIIGTTIDGRINPYAGSQLDASFNVTNAALKFTWGDVVRVKISSIGRVSESTRLGAPAVREFVMVPSAPLVVTDVSFNTDGSLNDIVIYTIRNNGSTISSLTTMSVFWDNVDDTVLPTPAPDMLSLFGFTNTTVNVGANSYIRNAGDISGNAWALTYPTLNADNNIIDLNYKVFTGSIGRSGSAGPAESTLKVKYLTGDSKENSDGSINPLAGLKAVFSVANGGNQSSNNTTSTASFKLSGV
jgi:hypothetical protein